jgi:hypothetical protein
MKRRMCLAGALVALLWATPAKADTGVIIRTTGGLPALQVLCLLPTTCTIVGALDGTLGQVFLVTTPLPLQNFLGLLGGLTGFVDAEVNQLLNLVGGLNILPTPIPATVMSNRTLVPYPAGSTTSAWDGYVNQPAASIVGVQDTQKAFNVLGTGIVADIDTGVDPTHPALQGVLLQGYDFTRNQPGGSELNDTSPCPFTSGCPPPPCPSCSPAKVNQSTAAVLDQSTAAVLDGTPYAAFGHGTMVMGVIHLVAPTAKLLPLKAFHSDGTASLSDILRAIYYGVQNGANVINMSFDITTASAELQKALDYTKQSGVICAASAGNDGKMEIVYPAALQTDVMGVASTTDQDARSSFSNYGNAIVWVAAPGEAIVSTYPYDTYAAGWGTSFSAPFVSGGAVLLHSLNAAINQSSAAVAVAHAVPLADTTMGHGRLDLCATLASVSTASCSQDFSVSAAPPSATITAGQQTTFTASATPLHSSTQTVTWSCTGAPAASTCTISPSSVTLDGKNAATATVTLSTMTRVLVPPLGWPRYAPPMPTWVALAACFAGLAVLLLFFTLGRALPKRPGLAAAAGLFALSLFSYACGGYGGPPPPGSATLSSIALNPMSVTGGSPSTGTVTLSGPAPSSGAAVSLSSDNTAAATVPASVTVAYGSTSATFTVSTSTVTASTPVTITASYSGGTKAASLTVTPQGSTTLSSIALNPMSVIGGSSSIGTVTLSGQAPTGGATVSLMSDNTAAATVPASVTVPAGASNATFTVSTSSVSTSTSVTISASYAGVAKTASLSVAPTGSATLSAVALNPMSVIGGSSSTGTVTLSGPAPSGGAAVSLMSDNTAAATVPASVTVAAGATSATFMVSTSAVTVSATVTISASYAGATKTASLTVLPPALTLSSLTLNPTSVTGGSPSTGTVTLSGPAPSGGASVSVMSGNTAAATVPASVTVAAGTSSATFTVSTSSVTASASVTISASYAGVTKTASLTVMPQAPPTLSSLTLNPTSVTGGAQSATGTVTLSGPALSGGAIVSLMSGNTAVATVQASVTVAAGASSATFTVSTSVVTTSTPVTISALYAGVTKTASLSVVPQALPNLSSLTLSPTSVTGGMQSSTGTVTLTGPALTGGAQVILSSNNGAASVPSSVTVTAGATSATFTVSTSAVTVSASVTISASYAGATKTASLTVLPQPLPTISSLTLNPTSVTGGSPSTGTVTLSGPAPIGGAVVSLSSSSTSTATVPATVTVAAGASSAPFTVNTSAVTTSTPVIISASYAGTTKTASLTVAPPGTPAGTYTLTITGTSGTVSHSTTVQVTVN